MMNRKTLKLGLLLACIPSPMLFRGCPPAQLGGKGLLFGKSKSLMAPLCVPYGAGIIFKLSVPTGTGGECAVRFRVSQ
jgi:hypothetical protein